jgi:para-nitrobenzyl esterase
MENSALNEIKEDSFSRLPAKQQSRRDILKEMIATAGAGFLATLSPEVHAAGTEPIRYPALGATTGDTISASDSDPVVEIVTGKVRGNVRKGIYTFKGIPYGDTTAGANRFMPPQKPKPWAGIRSSMQFGNVCPQAPRAGWANDEEAWLFSWDDGVPGEDCLRVNLWTPGINDGKKRPVMVWLHGGGFTAGSGQELTSYDGENLARRGDVVVVSLNHRLNVFGYLDLSHYGDRYTESANVGNLDIVAALEWVRDNIAGFGGDPNLVTIFGQSGGGGKVNALMAMPSAAGLFHRAIVESGSLLTRITRTTPPNLQLTCWPGSISTPLRSISCSRFQSLSWKRQPSKSRVGRRRRVASLLFRAGDHWPVGDLSSTERSCRAIPLIPTHRRNRRRFRSSWELRSTNSLPHSTTPMLSR